MVKKLLKKIVPLILIFPLISCQVEDPIIDDEDIPNHENTPAVQRTISKDLIAWNDKQKIRLLPHQLLVIDYLEKNDDAKGLLIYHYLGTGKTYLSIGFAERYPSNPIVIFAPRFLETHWKRNLASYGVTDSKRYTFIPHNQPEKLINMDLKNTIVIMDESHRIINQLSSNDPTVASNYTKVYFNLMSSYKLLSLTGTPVYGDISDIAYQINLVSKKTLLPFNKNEMRKNFTKINRHKAFLRGHLLESLLFQGFLSYMATTVAMFSFPDEPAAMIPVLLSSIAVPYLIKSSYPVSNMSMREFNADKLKFITNQYISYYDFNHIETKEYPSKKIFYENVSYNSNQLNLLMRFADGLLSNEEIELFLKDNNIHVDIKYLSWNNAKIQENLKNTPGSGREIGNLTYPSADNPKEVIYPKKFISAFKKMKSSHGPIVIYSHYYHNGILIFKQFLDAQGETGKYEILHPDMEPHRYENVIERYNRGEIKYLLIHPEITEGVSLKGTSQLHILEPSFNKAAQDQIIGRVVRYQSHAHLPSHLRHVDVYIWKQTFSNTDLEYLAALRNNWHENFDEVNFYTERAIIDKNTELKSISPDDRAYNMLEFLRSSSDSLKKLVTQYSIESTYTKEKNND